MTAIKAVDTMTRRDRRELLIDAVQTEKPGSAELVACVADVKACFVKWSLDAATWWVCDLVLDGLDLDVVREAARIVARQVREPSPTDFTTQATQLERQLAERERDRERRVEAQRERKQLPAMVDGGRAARLAIGIYGDIAAKLLPASEYDAEIEIRRSMSDAEVIARRNEMRGAR